MYAMHTPGPVGGLAWGPGCAPWMVGVEVWCRVRGRLAGGPFDGFDPRSMSGLSLGRPEVLSSLTSFLDLAMPSTALDEATSADEQPEDFRLSMPSSTS